MKRRRTEDELWNPPESKHVQAFGLNLSLNPLCWKTNSQEDNIRKLRKVAAAADEAESDKATIAFISW